MAIFKELNFVKQNNSKKTTKLQMFIPGINSGAYDKALHIRIWITEEKQKLFKKKKSVTYSTVTLSRKGVEMLRDECNKILEL